MRASALAIIVSLAWSGGASAADMALRGPQDAAPRVEPVLACDRIGPGYIKLPGEETCLRVFGSVRVDVEAGDRTRDIVVDTMYAGTAPIIDYSVANASRTQDSVTSFIRGQVGFDAVSATEAGPLRSVIQLNLDSFNGGSTATVEQAFIQFRGATVGRTYSFFDFSPGYALIDTYASNRVTNLVAYTHSFNQHVSASLSIEDGRSRRVQDFGLARYGAQRLPDVVASLQLRGTQFRAQVSGAIHRVDDERERLDAGYPTIRGTFGFAAQAGVEYLIPTHNNLAHSVMASVSYAQGALNYLGNIPFTPDYLVRPDGTLSLTQGLSVIGSYRNAWNQHFATAVTGSWYQTHNGHTFGSYETGGYRLALTQYWMPVRNLMLAAEARYTRDHVDAKYGGHSLGRAHAGIWSGMLRAVRSF
jgi:hypothetical protein